MPKKKNASKISPSDAAAESVDLREFEIFAQVRDPFDIEAATWVARHRNGLDDGLRGQLQAWLEADPRNAAAFDEMDAVFGRVGRLRDVDVAALKKGLSSGMPIPGAVPVAGGPSRRPARELVKLPTPSSRRWWAGLGKCFPHAAMAAAVLAIFGGSWVGWDRWQRLPAFDRSFATRSGEQLTIDLQDADASGSTMQLDAATQVEARFYRDRREVRLTDGQAMFTVNPDPGRPFHVWAGPLRITVAGTRFSVRHTASGLNAKHTVVSVEEGMVRVAQARGEGENPGPAQGGVDPSAIELTSGQMVVADESGRVGPVVQLPAGAIAPWRSGRINFDQTPLVDALAEFERYGPSGLVVRDPAVAALPVGGSYSTRQFQRFAQTLPQVLPVRLVPHGDVMEVVAQ